LSHRIPFHTHARTRSSADFNRLIAILKTAPGLSEQRMEAMAMVTRLRKTIQSHRCVYWGEGGGGCATASPLRAH